jgi:hypothetical protein
MAMTESQKRWNKNNREKVNEYQRYYRSQNNEKLKQAYTTSYEKNKEERTLYRRERHEASPWHTMSTVSKRRAREQGVLHTINASYLQSIWPANNSCPVFNIPFTISKKGESRDCSPSLDRIIPNLGYVQGNVVIVSLKANRMKNNGSLEDLRKVLHFYERTII